MSDILTATLQWQDRFDKAFGVTASDCSEYLDWPGKTKPFTEGLIQSMSSSSEPIDWDIMHKFRGQMKFSLYKSELIQANPALTGLEEAKVVFLVRSAGEARSMPQVDGGVIVADALWLSFASFCAQTLFASFPQGDDENADQQRLTLAVHFASRAILYREILLGSILDKERYTVIWETWPTEWEDGPDRVIYLWTGLGRFVVAHELAHILHHAPANCTLDGALQRGIVPEAWIHSLREQGDGVALDDYLYEVEADIEGMRMCANMFRDDPEPQAWFLSGVYYMFLCLEELARRVRATTVFPQRRYFIRKYLDAHPMAGAALMDEMERQFVGRAKFYFDVAEQIRPS